LCDADVPIEAEIFSAETLRLSSSWRELAARKDIGHSTGVAMLATFVIGLREGLEASLIVGIIAAFLKRNGKSAFAMWVGVGLAILLSVAVGIGLKLVEQALPQAGQEGMEAGIGALAIIFVSGMIAWMNTHARDLKRELEDEAAEAIGHASAFALAAMAFLAVLREGFETSVFLLATFSVAQSEALAVTGAIIGLLMAVLIGWAIYVGGVKLNLSRFFRVTGAFLILVAAGLVVSSLRSAHEAGWLNAGQQATVNLSWLVAPGTVRSALITGVLGIPADPRAIEVIGWFAYLVPFSLFVYWPASMRPRPRAAARLKVGAAAVAAAAAIGLIVAYPQPRIAIPTQAAIVAADGRTPHEMGTVQLNKASASAVPATLTISTARSKLSIPLSEDDRRWQEHDGLATSSWTVNDRGPVSSAPTQLTLEQVVALAGGRVPVGLNPRQHPGPFTSSWARDQSVKVWTADDILLDAAGDNRLTVTLSGGGLQAPRTISVHSSELGIATTGWRVAKRYQDNAIAVLTSVTQGRQARLFWATQLPTALLIIAGVLSLFAARALHRLRPDSDGTVSILRKRMGADRAQ
jgi:high-affinity iron transporter